MQLFSFKCLYCSLSMYMIICDIHYTDKMADFATFSSVVSQTVPLFVSYNPVLTCTIILKIWLVKVENASYKMCIIILEGLH